MSEKVAICVCTYKRPKMLTECLASLAKQHIPGETYFECVVVDNQPDGGNRELVERIDEDFPYPIHYVHQPDRGIPQARNAALSKALAISADWMAFIDDDEVASETWVMNLLSCADKHRAQAVQGLSISIYPAGTPSWLERGQYRRKRISKEVHTAITNNVIFRLDEVRKTGIRFDERLRFIGGEDQWFFRKLNDAGCRIVFDSLPVVYDIVSPDRATIRWQLRNAFRKGVCKITEAGIHHKKNVRMNGAISAVKRFLAGSAKVAFCPLGILLGWNAAVYVLLSGCRDLARSAGCIYGLLGYEFEYYLTTTGN